jgi:putative transposase
MSPKIIPFGERSLWRAMKDYIAHYHTERNHQGKNNLLLFHRVDKTDHDMPVRRLDRLSGLLQYYHQEAA